MAAPRFMQIALNTNDVVGSLRFYTEVFGFANSGSQALWGESMRIQGLDPSGRTLIWWMVGRQESVQLEFFHHTNPPQRPQREDWSPADHGWSRVGIGVPDFARTMAVLASWNVAPITEPMAGPGGRRLAFRDPHAGIIIEIIEESDALPSGIRHRHFDLDPFIVYAAASVSDLEQARRFYGEIIGLPILEDERLHRGEHERLWGLDGADRSSFLADAGGVMLEIVEYAAPRGRRRRADYRTSDQGIMNIGLRSADRSVVKGVIERLVADGHPCGAVAGNEAILCAYSLGADRELEILACPPDADEAVGFVPVAPLVGSVAGGDDFPVVSADQFLGSR